MAAVCEAKGENYTESAMGLEKIIVTGRRVEEGIGEASENISVLGSDEIKELPVRNLSEALQYIPGVDILPNQGFGRGSAISIQGSDARQVRVMIDGIPLNSQSSGQVNPAEFPVENIGRIEVIKGGASSVWGSGLGGVINIITKDTGDTVFPKGSVTTSFAGFDTRKKSVELSGKEKSVGYYALGDYMESGGKGPRDDVLEKKGFGKVTCDLKGAGKITSSFGYSDADVNSGVFRDGSWMAQPYRMRYGKIGWEKPFKLSRVKIDFKHSRQDVITKSFMTAADEEPVFRITNQDILYQLSINSNSRLRREKDLLVTGIDCDNDAVKSSSYLSKTKSLHVYAPYANYTLNLAPWDINGGLRYDHNSEFGAAWSPSLGAVYHCKLLPDTLLRMRISRAFNAPPLLWKYNENLDFFTVANPDIKAERAWIYEAGGESQLLPWLWAKLSLYHSDVRDAIAPAENELGQVYMKNFQKFRRQGAEFQCNVRLYRGLSFRGGAAFNDIEDVITKQTVRGGGRPRQSFDAALVYKNTNGLMISLIGYYNRWNEPLSSEPNDRKMLCDLKITREWKNLNLFLNVFNLTNSRYWADYFLPVPGRYFEGGCTFKW